MFDSGMGGLTVLHECLVQLPGEHFAYVGDTARFPYGEKSRDELELFSRQITAFLETVPVKLIVVACYSATSAALPALQERFETPIIGVVMPGARAAVESSRYRRIGVLATEATVASGAYPRAIHSLDSGAEVIQQACPGLVDFIEAGDVASQALADAVRGFTEPLKAQRPDVVIMGCTHYPLIAPMLQRFLGRDVTLINPAAEIAREVEAMLARQGLERPGDAMGSYRFYTTGDVERFRDTGARFLQMPLTRVRALPLERARRARRAMTSRFLVRAAVYAALYAALTLAPGLNALAYGQVQFRVSEALLIFACFDPAAVLGLTVGTAIANLGSPMMPVDMVVGAALTLLAAAIMYAHRAAGGRAGRAGGRQRVSASRPCWRSCSTCRTGRASPGSASARPRCCSRWACALFLVVRRRRELFGLTRPAA